MKLLLTVLTGLTLAASVPAMAETTGPTTAWHGHDHGGDRGDRGWDRGHHHGWDHHRWHRPYRCGFLGRFWCDDSAAAEESAQ